MLAKVARTAAGNPHVGNLGGKENSCILMHIQKEGGRGLRVVNLFPKLKNFSAKI